MTIYMTVKQAAELLGLTPRQVLNYCEKGKLGAKRQGGGPWLLLRSDVEAYAQERQQNPPRPGRTAGHGASYDALSGDDELTQQIIDLRSERKSFAEIAAALGVSRQAVHQRYHRLGKRAASPPKEYKAPTPWYKDADDLDSITAKIVVLRRYHGKSYAEIAAALDMTYQQVYQRYKKFTKDTQK